MEDDDVPILALRPDPFGDRDELVADPQPAATPALSWSADRSASEETNR